MGEGGGGGGRGREYSILQWPIRGDSSRKGYFFGPQVHPKVGLSLAEVYESVGKSVILAPGILVCKKAQKGEQRHSMAVKNSTKRSGVVIYSYF